MAHLKTDKYSNMALLVGTVIAMMGSSINAAERKIGGLEEVIVTAQKRAESLQDAPISISAYGEQSLEAMRIEEISDLAAYVPNMSMQKAAGSKDNLTYTIRGLSAGDVTLLSENAVGMYIDGVYIARNSGAAFDLSDVERIEVLRGPQGSLYGRNTIGGAINIVTNRPLEEFGFKQKLALGNRDYLVSRTSFDTGRLGDFAAKLSFNHREQGGDVRNLTTGRKDLGAFESDGYRLALNWTPSAAFSGDLIVERIQRDGNPGVQQLVHVRDSYAAFGGPVIQQAVDRATSTPLDEMSAGVGIDDESAFTDIDFQSLILAWDVGDITLKSISAHRKLHMGYDAGNSQMYPVTSPFTVFTLDSATFASTPVAVGEYVPMATSMRETNHKQVSQEFQVLGEAFDSRLKYIAGLYYFKEEGDDDQPAWFTMPGAFLGFPLGTDVYYGPFATKYGIESKSKAAFGQLTWSATDQLDLTLGMRYTRDDKNAELLVQGAMQSASDSWSNFDYSLTANYHFNEDISFYATYSTGYRAGGFTARAQTIESFTTPYDEEHATSHELGVKSEWLDSRVRLNGALFYVDYEDAQVNQFVASDVGLNDIIQNAGKATISGVELELTVLPIDGLMVALAYGHTHYKYDEFVTGRLDPVSASPAPTDKADQYGNEDIADTAKPLRAPKNTGSVIVAYDFSPTAIGRFSARIDATYQSRLYNHTQLNNYTAGENQTLLNARLTLSDVPVKWGDLSVALWGRNLADKRYTEASVDYGTLGFATRSFMEPRSYGVDLTYQF